MSVATYTKTGTKASVPAKLDKTIFGLEVKNHDLLKSAYVAFLANGRTSAGNSKTRGEIRGGGKKPWAQKGTGRARFGSSRNPIWRGGGVVFGPTGNENYSHKFTPAMKHQALRQALSLKTANIKVIETFECKDGKVAPAVKLLEKLDAKGNILLIISVKDQLVERAVNNITNLVAVQAQYVNVFDVLNADTIVVSKKALEILQEWLADPSSTAKKEGAK